MDGGFSLEFRGAREEIYKLLKALTDKEIPIVTLIEEREDLESLFMKVTKGEIG
jgi:ABC-type sugar transport system ATPase subunit